MNNTFTAKEVAKYLKVNYRTVLNLIKNGHLKATQIGKLYRITEEELKKYLKMEDVNNGN